ncbi:hypothetical protein BS47DRAFT_1331456 [Hydnum rufescens UP504]|uniref:COP9 signalosome complex subunit 4 n=1 Tax=Hydnum rufescens UP504 TaxID=1448309 RepID=A0A9P6ASW7_9AGAM|nr:hypothetical protein BS47DRAFT_1331456 [Hydnum rufescens UP504]
MSIQRKLEDISFISIQKDKSTAYSALLSDILVKSRSTADVQAVLRSAVNETPVVARQVLSELVKSLKDADFPDPSVLQSLLRASLEVAQPRGVTFEEQVTSLRNHLADLLEADEDWKEAAQVLMGINMDSNHTNEEKLSVYIRIVRLLLEEEEAGQAETYYNRAALLIHSTSDKTLQLQFKLCQARISDFGRKFVEAATRYHELSWVADIDEEERTNALSAAVTCAVLAPAGPNRARVLASLHRDERTALLPHYNILSKMYLDHIIRPSEIQGFEATLRPHQLARIAQSSSDKLSSALSAGSIDDSMAEDRDRDLNEGTSTRTGPSTVLDRAVMEHNLLSSSKIYNNITFSGLGALLDLTPGAAETMARKMIEQKRLRASIDQVERLIWFEARTDDEVAQGKAGGLGDVDQEEEETGAPFTKRWDMQIRQTASNVELIVQRLGEKGLLPPHAPMTVH